jgi:hypothetical protein
MSGLIRSLIRVFVVRIAGAALSGGALASTCGACTRALCYWAPRDVLPGPFVELLLRVEHRAGRGVSLGRVDRWDGSKRVG